MYQRNDFVFMNNQNYNQQPYQQPYQQPMQPAPQVPQQPKPKAPGFFGGDMLAIIACAASILGFAFVIIGAVIASTSPSISSESTKVNNFGAYGLVLSIFGMLFSAGGAFLSFVFGNNNIKAGKPRGTAATLGLVFGAVGFVLSFFVLFFAGCTSCAACKAQENLDKVKW